VAVIDGKDVVDGQPVRWGHGYCVHPDTTAVSGGAFSGSRIFGPDMSILVMSAAGARPAVMGLLFTAARG
jgi:hypothetical protein